MLKKALCLEVGGNQPILHLFFPYGHPFLPRLMVLRLQLMDVRIQMLDGLVSSHP